MRMAAKYTVCPCWTSGRYRRESHRAVAQGAFPLCFHGPAAGRVLRPGTSEASSSWFRDSAGVGAQTVLAHQRMEVRALHADLLGRTAHVALAALQRLGEESPLHFLDGRISNLLLEALEIVPRLGDGRDARSGRRLPR